MIQSEAAQWDIFLSYPSENEQDAQALYQYLLPLVSRTFFAPRSLSAGTRWDLEIQGALRNSRVIAPLITSATEGADLQRAEINRALSLEREDPEKYKVVPIILDSSSYIPWIIETHQAIYVEREGGLQGVADRLSELLSPSFPVSQPLIGAVLYVNVLGFSKFPQGLWADGPVGFLTKQIELCDRIFGPIYWLDFRGGEFSLFLKYNDHMDSLSRCLFFGMHLLMTARTMASQIGTPEHPFQLGITIHTEYAAEWRTIITGGNAHSKRHLVGSGLNHARHLMMCFSDRPYLLLSESAYHQLGGDFFFKAKFLASLKALASRERKLLLPSLTGTYMVKPLSTHDLHKIEHKAYSLYALSTDGKLLIGDDRQPQQRVSIEYRASRFEQNTFVERLVQSDSVAIVGITHENLVGFLDAAIKIRQEQGKEFWESLQIIFPSESFLNTILDQHDRSAQGIGISQRKEKWQQGRKLAYQYLLGLPDEYRTRWQCSEYPGNLSFVGQRFIFDNSKSVRVAPILAGADVKDSYYMEVFSGSRAFAQLSDAFDVMIALSKPIVEWNICLNLQGTDLKFKGIVNRTRRKQAHKHLRMGQNERPCFPVVLIMLYFEDLGTMKAILQKRTPYNAASDFQKYSNISGSLTDQDILKALDDYERVIESEHYKIYIEQNYLAVQHDDSAASESFLLAITQQLTPNAVIPERILDKAWLEAAIREIYEELGLKVSRDRLSLCTRSLPLKRSGESYDLVFRIFNLKLTQAEWQQLKLRPRSELETVDWDQLEAYYKLDNFNHLLQKYFEDVFTSIYNNLGIKPLKG